MSAEVLFPLVPVLSALCTDALLVRDEAEKLSERRRRRERLPAKVLACDKQAPGCQASKVDGSRYGHDLRPGGKCRSPLIINVPLDLAHALKVGLPAGESGTRA